MTSKHIIVTTQIRVHTGPTHVGDLDADPRLMAALDAQLTQELGNTFAEYVTPLAAREVLDRLVRHGYRIVASCGVGQTCIWTLVNSSEPASQSIETTNETAKSDCDSAKTVD